MLSGGGNENGEKTTIAKKQLCTCSTFFCTLMLCRCFARPQRETSKNYLLTRFVEMSYLPLSTFFHSLIFTLVAARISHFLTAAKKFSCCYSNKYILIFRSCSLWLYFSLSLVGLSPTLFFLYIPNLWT